MIFEYGLHCSIMFWLNLSILIATMGGEWCMPAAAEVVITAGQDDDPLSQFDRGSSADDRSDLRHLRLWQKEMEVDSSTGRPAASPTTKPTVPWQSRLSAGFFRRRPNDIDKRPAARRRVTHRPKDIGGADTPEQVTSYDYIDSGSPKTAKSTATKSTVAARILFSTEDECVSANKGRACVCFMTDFLDLIVQRLDETVDDEDETAAAVALNCHSFKSVPTAFLVYPVAAAGGLSGTTASTAADVVVERNGGKSGGGRGRGGVGLHVEKKAADVPAVPSWKEVDFDDVVNYRLEKSSDDHYAVQYGLVGSDAKVPCVINGNGTRMNAFKWDFKKDKHKTNSTVVGTDTNILLILGLEPGDSKNYTCIPKMVGDSKNGTSYKHYVVAVEKAIYEIRGSVVYKTRGDGGCTHDVTVLVQKQLPSSIRNELCPEGSSRYACNVIVEKPKCAEDKRTMEIKYLVTLNDKANYLARIRTSKKGRIAQRYQKLLARISSVLASNLNKTLTVPIISKLSLIDTNFGPDSSRMNLKKFVSCTPGFGIREVFCAACPPHHYSPDKSIECLKCVKGFHQPVAGSENLFIGMFNSRDFVCILLPRRERKNVLSSSQTEDTPDSISSVIKKKT
ncbi:hypothetical protein AGLY_004924, partial [Aphis glycines]